MKNLFEICKDNPQATIGIGFVIAYSSYYVLLAVRPPRISAGSKLKGFLKSHCPVLKEKFWPTFWCFESRVQTIVGHFLRYSPSILYEREVLTTPDGGLLSLDWHGHGHHRHRRAKRTTQSAKPTVIFMPGLTGDSQSNYVLQCVELTVKLGYRAVVFNYRGMGGIKLQTGRTYCAANTEDVEFVLSHIRNKLPNAPLVAVGFSMGGMKLCNYLDKTGKSCGLLAGMTVSAPWNSVESSKSLEEPINYIIFNKILADNLVHLVKANLPVLQGQPWFKESVYSSKTVREFDEHFTCGQFGYDSWLEYYKDASIDKKIQGIRIPVLCLNAADDVFSPARAFPTEEAQKSSHVAIIETAYGGHLGFLEGIFPRQTSYINRVFTQYIRAVFENQKVINDM